MMKTIGYGDIHVFSQAGYILSVLNMIFGALIVSSFLLVIRNTIKMSPR